MNGTEMASYHIESLRREADGERLARKVRPRRSKRSEVRAQGRRWALVLPMLRPALRGWRP